MLRKVFIKIVLFLSIVSLVSCKGIEFENQKSAKAEEFSRGEAMIYVAEEKNKYENKFGTDLWLLKSGDGNLYFKDYILSVTKGLIEKIMILKLAADDLNIIISTADNEKLKLASSEYYASLSLEDMDYICCSEQDVYNAFKDFHTARLVIDNLSKNANAELSISEAKVIRVQYIIFDDEESAKKTAEDLKAKGANFAYFAKTRSKSTDIEMIIKRGDEMSIRFPELFYLSAGQTSDVLKFRNNYYLFKCVDDYLVKETEERRLEVLRATKNDEFNINFKKYEDEYIIRSNSSYWRDIDLQKGYGCKINKFEDIYYSYFPKSIK